MEWQQLIAEAWANRELLKEKRYTEAVRAVIEETDKGRLRVASPTETGWVVNEWVKQAILMYFAVQPMQTWSVAPFEFYDKMVLKSNYKELGVRAVPHAVARYGAFIAKNVVLMPSYVNIGAYVDEGTMVDTWATVGSCAQIGKGVHLSGGVGIGGVLEPLQASPVVVEDGSFIGSRCIVMIKPMNLFMNAYGRQGAKRRGQQTVIIPSAPCPLPSDYTLTLNSLNASLRLVFRSVDGLRCPMINAQLTEYSPAGNCFL